MKTGFYLPFVSFIFLLSCHPSSKIGTTSNEGLHFGHGGGFTGKVQKYFLETNGGLYVESQAEMKLLGKLKKSETKQILTNYYKLGLDSLQINKPGNYYRYIEMKKGDKLHMLKWDTQLDQKKELETFYAILMTYVKKWTPKD